MTQRFSLLLWLLAGLTAFAGTATAQAPGNATAKSKVKPLVTTVYIVRHAEKDSASDRANPTLSALGQTRALALRQTLVRHQPVALFTTDTKRTRATLAPLAEALKLEPQVYDPSRGRDLADLILKKYAGKEVVIVGHSNTVLSLIDDFAATPPIEEIGENEYEYLFTVRIVEGAMPTVDMRGYGPERRPGSKTSKTSKGTPMVQAVPVK